MQVFSGQSVHVILVRGLKSFHAANTKSFIPENQVCSRSVVLVWDLFREKTATHQMIVPFKPWPVCVHNQQQNALSVLVSGSRYPQAFILKAVPLLY